MLELLIYAGIGAVAGFFAGLLGVGGGAIVGPLLILVYSELLEFDPVFIAHLAIGTACGVMVLTVPMSAATHIRQGNVDWRLAGILGIGVIIGALIGASSAALAPGEFIKILLVIFLMATAVNMLLPLQRKHTMQESNRIPTLTMYELSPTAFLIGFISAVLGIGGGALTVPYLNRRGVLLRQAIGTSAFVGLPLSLSAAIGYIWAGSQVPQLPGGSWGYVYLPALFGISIFSVGAAYCGARLTNKLPATALRKIFALMASIIALRLLWSVISE